MSPARRVLPHESCKIGRFGCVLAIADQGAVHRVPASPPVALDDYHGPLSRHVVAR